jgi:cell wall-associated NlpC family hydrolase
MENYWLNDEAVSYGIVQYSVVNMRAYSVFQSELINQVLLGTVVAILDQRDEFYLIQSWDGYRGWVSRHALVTGDEKMAEDWSQSRQVMVRENYGVVCSEPDKESDIITDLVPCAFLKTTGTVEHFFAIEMPGRQAGYVKKGLVIEREKQEKIKISGEKIIEQARKFLGIPYLWGGNSSKGFDCSGFVQTVFRMLNVYLPRDSGPQSRDGETILLEGGPDTFRVGDLLFFGKSAKRINHVAIYIGNGLYIHSRGKVGINSLLPEHPQYNDYLKKLFVKVQRVI